MMLVATDGHRLALVTAPREGDPKVEETRTILPKKTLLELGRLLADGDGTIRFAAQREPPLLPASTAGCSSRA